MLGIENHDWLIRPPWQNMAELGRSRESTKFHLSFPLFSTCTVTWAICGNLGQSACADYLTACAQRAGQSMCPELVQSMRPELVQSMRPRAGAERAIRNI